MPPIDDQDKLEKIHARLNRKLAVWEKQKAKALIQDFRRSETEIKALLVSVEGWEKVRLESLLVEIDRVIDRLEDAGEMWVRGRSDVSFDSPQASLYGFPAMAGGQTALDILGITGTFSLIHIPVLSYMQDYQLGLIRRVTADVRAQIKEELKRGYIQGESIPEIAKRLRNTKLDKGVWPSVEKRAVVIARTEIIRASSAGAKFVYESYGVSRVKWLAAIDERTCPICGALHGKIFPINNIPYGSPPAHPMCRCYITPSIATSEDEGKQFDNEAKDNLKWFKEKQSTGQF